MDSFKVPSRVQEAQVSAINQRKCARGCTGAQAFSGRLDGSLRRLDKCKLWEPAMRIKKKTN